ncbi:hypothetical protein [Dryocola sp. BD586]|uniref:hypothetical protein n=1 Tax=Dryocola sp. BD586 TaxID=3133271 RepID=UPI003F50BAA8
MYNDELEVAKIPVDNLYLDPNNPRFFEKNKKIPLARYTEKKIQDEALKAIKDYNVNDLVNSIIANGFLPMDRIVVKQIGDTENYYALEGNRRLASIKSIRHQIDSNSVELDDKLTESYYTALNKSLENIEVLIYKGDRNNISWMLQGIRHISGIKDWSPTQRAKLVSELIENEDQDFTSVGKQFGLSAIAVGRLYRGYRGLQQMKEDSEFSNKAQNDYFTLFEEAHKNKDVRKWMKWNDEKYLFEEPDNFKQFCSWISKDEDRENSNESPRRLHDSRHVRMLGNLISKNRDDLISQIDQFEITIEQATGPSR